MSEVFVTKEVGVVVAMWSMDRIVDNQGLNSNVVRSVTRLWLEHFCKLVDDLYDNYGREKASGLYEWCQRTKEEVLDAIDVVEAARNVNETRLALLLLLLPRGKCDALRRLHGETMLAWALFLSRRTHREKPEKLMEFFCDEEYRQVHRNLQLVIHSVNNRNSIQDKQVLNAQLLEFVKGSCRLESLVSISLGADPGPFLKQQQLFHFVVQVLTTVEATKIMEKLGLMPRSSPSALSLLSAKTKQEEMESLQQQVNHLQHQLDTTTARIEKALQILDYLM